MAERKNQFTKEQLILNFKVDECDKGERLDCFLKKYLKRLSRVRLQTIIKNQNIEIKREQGKHLSIGRIKASLKLLRNDEIIVYQKRSDEPFVNFNYKTIYEDADILVIDKPAPIPVHPAGKYLFNTLLSYLYTLDKYIGCELFLVHRIDKETSGILVLAKSKECCAHLMKQFSERKIKKRYLAIVRGNFKSETETVNLPIGKDTNSKLSLKMTIIPEKLGGSASKTIINVLERRLGYTLVECLPETGRQHQIRVHLDAIGFPIAADPVYGFPEINGCMMSPERLDEASPHLSRQALHAAGISFTHPVKAKKMDLSLELPSDLADFWTSIPEDKKRAKSANDYQALP